MGKNSILFGLTFVALFALSYAFMAMVDALPEPQSLGDATLTEQPIDTTSQLSELPVRVVAKDIGMENNVLNPESTDVEDLDAALLKGAVRYPTSAALGADGTVLIFGHSSYLPIVRNQNYKAFNGIQKLKQGEVISVYSGTHEYRYTVTSVKTATADEDQVLRISLPEGGKQLMLVTCDSFGSKSTRFVVTADFAGMYSM